MAAYCDDSCKYLGGDPRLDDHGECDVTIDSAGLTVMFQDAEHQIHVPSKSVQRVYYEVESLGMEQAEYEEDVILDGFETLERHTAVVVVGDPEDIVPGGFKVRLGFRNDYYAKLFVKRCTEILHAAPF